MSPVPQALQGSPIPPRASPPSKQGGSPLGALARPPSSPLLPLQPPVPPQHGEMELNLSCIRLSLAFRSTKRLKNNKEKAKPSAIITSL